MQKSVVAGSIGVLLGLSSPSFASSVEEFYKGRTLRVLVGTAPGTNYDAYTRIFAENIGRFIPGAPSAIVENMPGAGQFRAARFVYEAAPRDGSVFLGVVQSVAIDTALGSQTGIKAEDFSWIGRFTSNFSVAIAWHTTGVHTIEDARQRELLIGVSGPRELNGVIARTMNVHSGTRYKVVPGYAGGIGEIFLAIERGEVNSFVPSVSFLRNSRPNWLKENKVSLLYQVGLQRHPEMPDLPTMGETAATKEGRAALDFISSSVDVGRSIVGTPGMPAERVEAVRKAFDEMVKDPGVIATIKKRNLEFETATGAYVEKVVREAVSTPPAVLDTIRKAIDGL
ncbi:MAG: tripartite tricarboxylate transporter substrate-binding protein [Beijerinckiaceae bacterium]|nr:tripartite tricarboxylate transporter substrate-binding protein [Beijerinckiaceae bacterium]